MADSLPSTICRAFGWTHASVVYSNSDYGTRGLEKLEELASSYGICFSSPLRLDHDRQDYDDVIESLVNKTDAKGRSEHRLKNRLGSYVHYSLIRAPLGHFRLRALIGLSGICTSVGDMAVPLRLSCYVSGSGGGFC